MTNVTIEVELLSGRYHAHVWGEAQFGMAGPEWPPSPWRLLRALASAWFRTHTNPSESDETTRNCLLEALGKAGAPKIWLPPTSFHENRYYQPIRLGASDRVLHHDHFAVPKGGCFWFQFKPKQALQPPQHELLTELLRRIRYFGRSESRAHLRLVNLTEPPHGVYEAVPRNCNVICQSDNRQQPMVYRRVLCTTDEFEASYLWSPQDDRVRGHPPHLVDALLKEKMPLPRGTRWVEYAVPAEALVHEIRPQIQSGASASPAPPTVRVSEVRFRLNRRVPLRLLHIVAVARAFRDAVVEAHQRIANGQISPTLSGRQLNGTVAQGHQHAYYLPCLCPKAVTFDELVVRVPNGQLTRPELDALLSVERIRISGPKYPITVIAESIVESAANVTGAKCWCSATPFLPPLHHRQGRNGTQVEQQVTAACIQRRAPRPEHVERIRGPGGFSISPILAHEYLTGEGHWTLTRRLGFWLKLTFNESVVLDTPLGADAHFGAGQFVPAENNVSQ